METVCLPFFQIPSEYTDIAGICYKSLIDLSKVRTIIISWQLPDRKYDELINIRQLPGDNMQTEVSWYLQRVGFIIYYPSFTQGGAASNHILHPRAAGSGATPDYQ